MISLRQIKRNNVFLSFGLAVSFILAPSGGYAQSVLGLPAPGTMILTSPAYTPVIMTGMTIHPDNPLQFDFIVDIGDDKLQGKEFRRLDQLISPPTFFIKLDRSG